MAWFERHVIHSVPVTEPGRGRRVYPGFLQLAGFMSMNPERHLEKQQTAFWDRLRGDDDAADRVIEFYDEYFSVLDLHADFYLETIDRVFQRRALVTGAATHRGQPIDPACVTALALQTIEADADDVCAPGQTVAAHAVLSGVPDHRRDHMVATGVGHYGGFAGSKFRRQVLPRLVAFASRHGA
jgi:poly(3-hydroxybutyrate) depolymerase